MVTLSQQAFDFGRYAASAGGAWRTSRSQALGQRSFAGGQLRLPALGNNNHSLDPSDHRVVLYRQLSSRFVRNDRTMAQASLPRRNVRFRAGMSLLELMLVLALLVIIGSLALPAFRAPFANQRLRKAGELVRVEWAKARNRAMKTGQIQVFQYDADGSGYRIEPYLTEQDVLETDLQTSQELGLATPGGVGQSVPTRMQQEPTEKKHLPDGVIFAGGSVASDSRLMQYQEQITTFQSGDALSTIPILFYPDGTSSDTRLILMNEEPLFVVVTLRGLTGIARVSDLLTHDDIAQLQ